MAYESEEVYLSDDASLIENEARQLIGKIIKRVDCRGNVLTIRFEDGTELAVSGQYHGDVVSLDVGLESVEWIE